MLPEDIGWTQKRNASTKDHFSHICLTNFDEIRLQALTMNGETVVFKLFK